MQKQKIDKNTNNKIMLFYDFLYTAYKDVWTLLVYPGVPWGQNRTAFSVLPVNKYLSTDKRLTLRIYRNFLGRKSFGQSKQLVPPFLVFESQVKHPSYILDLTFITFKKRYTKYSRFKLILFSDPFITVRKYISLNVFRLPLSCIWLPINSWKKD